MASLSRIFRKTRNVQIEAVTEPKASTFQDVTEPDRTLRPGPRLPGCLLGQRDKQLLGMVTKGLNMVVLIF